MHKLHTIFGSLVHAFDVHGGAEHSTYRAENRENSKGMAKIAHTQIDHMSDVNRAMPWNWYQVLCVQHTFWASPKTLGFSEWQGRQVSP